MDTSIFTMIFNTYTVSILFIVLGNIVVERSGILNLAIDGFVTLIIALSFVLSLSFDPLTNVFICLVCGILISCLIVLLNMITFAPHALTGLAITYACYGLSMMIANPYLEQVGVAKNPQLIDLDMLSTIVLMFVPTITTWMFLDKTSFGLTIKICGIDPKTADSLGIDVWKVRLFAAIIGYSMISIGSSLYYLGYIKIWTQGLGMGMGWLCLVLSMASLWNPLIALPIVVLIGFLYTSMWSLQLEYGIPDPLINMTPFIASIAIAIIVHVSPLRRYVLLPRALGSVFFREERSA